MERRKLIKIAAITGVTSFIPSTILPAKSQIVTVRNEESLFRFCLNTSTISGQKPGLLKYIEIASKTGYDGIELWVRDVKQHIDSGNSASSLKNILKIRGLQWIMQLVLLHG